MAGHGLFYRGLLLVNLFLQFDLGSQAVVARLRLALPGVMDLAAVFFFLITVLRAVTATLEAPVEAALILLSLNRRPFPIPPPLLLI